jgi:hypothetical protein
VSTYILSACWRIDWLTPSQKLVLISLADQANDEGVCWPSVKTLGVRTCLSERAIRDALRSLEEVGLLQTDQREGRSSYYTVTPANGAPRQMPPPSPAAGAPPPRQQVPAPPANAAPITINEPSVEPPRNQEPSAPTAPRPVPPSGPLLSNDPITGQPFAFPLNTGADWPLTHDDYAEMKRLYPAADVAAELRKARGWLIGNPTKRKTARGMLRFLHTWLARVQDRGGNTHAAAPVQGRGGMSVADRVRARADANDRARGGDFDQH